MSIVSVLNQDSLVADKCVQVSYALDGRVKATSSNYVAVCVTSSAEGEYITYSYATNSPNAQVSVAIEGYEPVLENQALEVRFYDAAGKTCASCPFTLTGEAVESFEYSFLQSYVYEDNIIATFQLADALAHRPSSSDYMGVCTQGASEGDYYCYAYCVGARSGSLPIHAGGWQSSLEHKNLVLRYYSPDNVTVLESEPFTFTRAALSIPPELEVVSRPPPVVEPTTVKVTTTTPSPSVVSSPSPSPAPSVVVPSSSPAVTKAPTQVSTPSAAPVVASTSAGPVASGPSVSYSQAPTGEKPVATLPSKRHWEIVDGAACARVARFADASPADIPPTVEDDADRELRELKAQYRPSSPVASSSPGKPKKKKTFLKKLAGGVAAALAQPDFVGERIAGMEQIIAERDQKMAATPKPRDMDDYLSRTPRPCQETASLRVGMILAKQSHTSHSGAVSCLYEIRDLDGPMLLLHDLSYPPSDHKFDHWVVYHAPVLGSMASFGRPLASDPLEPFVPHHEFFWEAYLRHVDRAPVPASFFASRPRRERIKDCSYAVYRQNYVEGYWSMANLPLVDPLQGMQRVEPSPTGRTPDYSLVPHSNQELGQKWNNNTILRLNHERVTPQELLRRAQSGQIQWEQDAISSCMEGLEDVGRRFHPLNASPWASLRNPTRVTPATPLPWFFLWEDPPALLGGSETDLAWEWHTGTLVSLEELQAKLTQGEAQWAQVMDLQKAFYRDDSMPSMMKASFLKPAWLPSISMCPHAPCARGREDMAFWVRHNQQVQRVTLKALEDACLLGLVSAKDTSFSLPGLRADFDSYLWPCHVPMPAEGWKNDIVPCIFQAFPAILFKTNELTDS